MRGAPVPPDEYDGGHLNTDEKLREEGWAAGLDVWEQVGKGYSEWYLNDDTLGNAQLWSLQEAIRAAERARLADLIERQAGEPVDVTPPGGTKRLYAERDERRAAGMREAARIIRNLT